MLVLFVHVLVHPLVHAMGTSASSRNDTSVAAGSTGPSPSQNAGDRCELCRVGHNTIATPDLPKTDLLNPGWVRTELHAVNYASLLAGRATPSRAPPNL